MAPFKMTLIFSAAEVGARMSAMGVLVDAPRLETPKDSAAKVLSDNANVSSIFVGCSKCAPRGAGDIACMEVGGLSPSASLGGGVRRGTGSVDAGLSASLDGSQRTNVNEPAPSSEGTDGADGPAMGTGCVERELFA